MKKRWEAEVWFRSPTFPKPVLIKTKRFRFLFMARIFAHENDHWSGWKQTTVTIKDATHD